MASPRRLFSPGMPQRPSTWLRGHGVQLTSRCLAPEQNGEEKKNRGRFETEPRSGDEILLTVMDREGLQFGCFNNSNFESLSALIITLISFALRAFRLATNLFVAFLTGQEHHSNLVPWQQLAESNGAKLKFGRLRSNGTLEPWISRVFLRRCMKRMIHRSLRTLSISRALSTKGW